METTTFPWGWGGGGRGLLHRGRSAPPLGGSPLWTYWFPPFPTGRKQKKGECGRDLYSHFRKQCAICRLLLFSIPGPFALGAIPPQTRMITGFFAFFKNLPKQHRFNEWYVRNSSRKVRVVLRAKVERGERLGTRAPCGYRTDENDSKKLVVDEEAAAIVCRIFAMCAAGSRPSQIARKLREEQILCPTTYVYQKFGISHTSLNTEKPYHWSDSTIANILENGCGKIESIVRQISHTLV